LLLDPACAYGAGGKQWGVGPSVEPRKRLHDRLTGQHDHSLDEKGRISVPADFRGKLGLVEGAEVVLTRHVSQRCVLIYRPDAFEAVLDRAEQLQTPEADLVCEVLSGSARPMRVDKLGRITVPSTIRAHARLVTDCYVIGQDQRIEVWDREHWESVHDAERFQHFNFNRLL